MRPTRSLGILKRQFLKRIAYLEGLVRGLAPPVDEDHDRKVSFAVIEAHTLWENYGRCLVVSCATGTRDSGGALVSVGVARSRQEADAIDFAVRTIDHRKTITPAGGWTHRDEPNWYDTRVVARLLRALGASVAIDYDSAVAAQTTRVLTDLRTFRNFYGHRSGNSAERVRSRAPHYMMSPRLHPTELLCNREPTRPVNILVDWLSDLRGIGTLLP